MRCKIIHTLRLRQSTDSCAPPEGFGAGANNNLAWFGLLAACSFLKENFLSHPEPMAA